jgi:hypothetical protein
MGRRPRHPIVMGDVGVPRSDAPKRKVQNGEQQNGIRHLADEISLRVADLPRPIVIDGVRHKATIQLRRRRFPHVVVRLVRLVEMMRLETLGSRRAERPRLTNSVTPAHTPWRPM